MFVKKYPSPIMSILDAYKQCPASYIGSTNLVKPKAPVKPELNNIGQVKFFNTMNVFLPEPLVIENNQRAKGPFC